ncbi:conserved hypothetical protein [Histoplasma mississippiense (nom. inval.)]|uniref:conserved hypothetical protein n=1 Tax=Ajellomyces capsulatus (strain NAm1 / WU24) TaxID=2059318 RepID=UPI000157CCD2|nr:conserved hypothetical protein [Histoplasma mississippiense (nom. inval.)]EDN10109.1 conserved hypothetical protein [Histoplasma mississippiense (nom. inval.)]
MADPAGGVPQQLLPHMHLVSSYRYPLMNNLSHETAVEYLISAPKVVRELQTMHWMFLDGPPDGTVILVWQPLNHLGTNFASDGYVWADAEQLYSTEIRGYNLELYLQRCGYHPPNEQIATHCRKRYRLTPTKNPNANVLPCDPSLWIIHYSRTPAGDQIPANRILVTPQMQNILAQRRFLQSQGQLVRKEFMLHDRNSWPTINLPPQVGQQNFMPHGAPYANPMLGRQQSGPFYQQQQGQNLPGPQSKPSRSNRAKDVGDEFWRVEGHLDTSTREESPPVEYSDNRPKAKVDDIINNLQKALGKSIVRITEISCVEEGGLQKRVVPPETTSDSSRRDIDMGMSLRQAADSKQQQSPSHAASAGPVPTPVAAPTTQQTEVGKVSALPAGATLQTPSTSGLPLPTEPSKPDGSGDVEMGGVELANAAAATTITGNQTGEWVIVSKEEGAAPQDASIAVVSAIEGGYNHPTSTELTGAAAPAPVTAATGADIPVSELQGLKSAANTDLSEASALETSNFDDAAEFSNLDSVADALAAYGEQNDDLGMGDLDNSAFGEAFHASEAER